MDSVENRNAYIQRVVGYTDGNIEKVFVARTTGVICHKISPLSKTYESIFIPKGFEVTIAELEEDQQIEIRSGAWKKFAEWYVSLNK